MPFSDFSAINIIVVDLTEKCTGIYVFCEKVSLERHGGDIFSFYLWFLKKTLGFIYQADN